jgi:farnesyl-diphosphate farnesyltransferase
LIVAWFLGARFDIAIVQFKEQMGDLLGFGNSTNTTVVKVVTPSEGHSEL